MQAESASLARENTQQKNKVLCWRCTVISVEGSGPTKQRGQGDVWGHQYHLPLTPVVFLPEGEFTSVGRRVCGMHWLQSKVAKAGYPLRYGIGSVGRWR
jgi:hypothetical protein